MKKLFLLLALVGLFATSCEMNEVPPVKQVHFELSHNNISINAGGGTASVMVFSNDYWEIEGTSDWCSPSVRSGGANEDGTTVNFVAKESYAPREATFYFLCGEMRLELKVSQEQKDVIFADENDKFSIPAKGGVALIEYQTNVECEVIIPNEAQDWISLTSTRALRDESIGLDIAPNESYDPRSATIMVVAVGDNTLCAKYIINQEQTDVILAGEDNKFAVPSDGADVSIDFETNVKYNVNIPSNAKSWITLVDATRGIAPRSITLRVAKNTTYEKRSAVISITKDGATKPVVEYTIEQAQNDGIVFEGDTLLAPAKGGSVALDYQANVDCEVIIPDDAKEWISIDPQTRGLEKYSVTLMIAPNDSFDERTTAIKVEGETVSRDIEVKQMGIERVLSLSPSKLDLPLEATNITIDIDANIDYEVVIADDCDWVTMPEAENTIENKVILAIAENPTIYSRDTEILFKGDGKDVILPVVQRGDEGVLMLNDKYIADGQDTVLSIEFNSNFDYTVSIPSTCDWLSLPETRAVVQTHTIEFALTKNPSLDNRSVEVIFSDAKGDISKSVKITQLGSPLYCVVPNANEVLYITTDGEVLDISDINLGSTTVIDHTYVDGIGRITCSSDITLIDGFYGCTTLEQIAIPDSVTEIGEDAFSRCTSLKSITIPDSVTEIGYEAFCDCISLTGINIPDSVTEIGYEAFYGCHSLKSVTIGNGVTSIGSSAFSGCTGELIVNCNIPSGGYTDGIFYGSNFTKVTIGDSVTKIGSFAFYNCDSLTSVTIGNGVTTIGYHTFSGCSSLTSVTIPNSVTLIGNEAFRDCTSLTSVTIGNSITTIGLGAFYGCTSLTSVTIPDSVTEIGYSAFEGCSSLTSVTIPDSVTEIGGRAFYGCDSLTSVTIPDSVTSIGLEAFRDCTSLTSVTIPDSVTEIGYSAFEGCTGELIINNKIIETDYSYNKYPANSYSGWLYGAKFTELTIGDNFTKIGNEAFRDCTSLTSVTIGNSITTIGLGAFYGCDSLTSVTIPDSVTEIGGLAFEGCSSLTSVTIPNSVTSIGSYAFYGCSSLTGINIPDSVTSIGLEAFYGCDSLTSVTIPDSVTEIGYSAFEGCTGELIINNKIIETDYSYNKYPANSSSGWLYGAKFTELTIGDNITKIGNYAFRDCSSLTSITIPDSVTTIGGMAFYGCTGELIINSNIIETDYSYNNYPINNSSGWLFGSKFTKLTIGDNITKIGDYAFKSCSLTSVTIPDSVTSIGSYAFYGCDSLTSVTIGNGVTSIGNSAFSGCSSLTSVTIPNSVTRIGEGAFYGCSSLTGINIPDSVTSIGLEAFYGCTGELIINSNIIETDYSSDNNPTNSSSGWLYRSKFTKLTIGDNITKIGDYAFKSCSLTSVTIPDSVTTIGSYAFKYCSSLTNATIGNSVTSIGDDAFCCCSMTSVTIPDSVTRIGEGAFYLCNSLKSVTIPNSVTSIGLEAFYGCTGELIINSNIIETDYSSDNNPTNSSSGWLYRSKFTKLTIGDNITKIGDYAFEGCSSLTSVTIPDSVTTIGSYAFKYCSSLTNATIGNSVTSIGDDAFCCCSMTSVTIPDSVTRIGEGAFSLCTSLKSVTIPNSVTSIGNEAFRDCDSLTSVTIGNGVTTIGDRAFADCSSLKEVYCKPTTPPTGGSSMFFENASGRKIYVPRDSVEAYKSAQYWKNYADSIVGYDF